MTKLSSTSALVLLWTGQEPYKSKLAKDYFNALDLTPGLTLFKTCNEICPYYNEVILNRKFGVFKLISECLNNNKNINQVIIAGSGLDPLGIEITEFYPRLKVFELDTENMDVKSGIFTKLSDTSGEKIPFITVDLLNSSEVYERLKLHDWNPYEHTLLILEGISYYLPIESLQNLFKVIEPDRTVFEYLKQKEEIYAEQNDIAEKVFGIISEECGGPNIIRYSSSNIKDQFGSPVLTRYNMKELEMLRNGSNKYFPDEKSGWIEVCLLGM